jgi:hypothetical protein
MYVEIITFNPVVFSVIFVNVVHKRYTISVILAFQSTLSQILQNF